MACRQIDIARRVGLDVSSVNKILNKTPGPVFHKDTIQKVFLVAEAMGYDVKSTRIGRCRRILGELVRGGHITGVGRKRMEEIKQLAGLA
jgi:hypothetical protein